MEVMRVTLKLRISNFIITDGKQVEQCAVEVIIMGNEGPFFLF